MRLIGDEDCPENHGGFEQSPLHYLLGGMQPGALTYKMPLGWEYSLELWKSFSLSLSHFLSLQCQNQGTKAGLKTCNCLGIPCLGIFDIFLQAPPLLLFSLPCFISCLLSEEIFRHSDCTSESSSEI